MPNAPFLAPERDPALKIGRPKASGGTVYYAIPGFTCSGNAVEQFGPNIDYYFPMWTPTPILVDQIAAEVTTVHAANNFRIGLYLADTNWQPVGGPLADSGDISTATTGVKTYTPGTPILIPRGRFLGIINSSTGTARFRVFQGAHIWSSYATGLGASPQITLLFVSRSYAAFPTPGTAWDSISNFGVTEYPIVLRVSSP